MRHLRGPALGLVAILLVGTACKGGGGGKSDTTTHTAALAAPGFPATRWAPARPAYLISARTVKDAQHGLRDVIDALGTVAGVGIDEASRFSREVLQVDVFSPDPVAGMGIDLDGGIAVFSEEINPTIVVHLAAPDQAQAFFDRLRDRGAAMQSVIVDKTEIFTAKITTGVHVSWAIADDWLWVHFAFDIAHEEGTGWFTAKQPAAAEWGSSWSWATQNRKPGKPAAIVGFGDLKKLANRFAGRVPEVLACARLLEPVNRVGLAIESDGARAGGQISVDVGASSSGIASAGLPIVEGWASASSKAALAVQWNLDLPTVFGWFAPCVRQFGLAPLITEITKVGVRGGRAFVESIDIDDTKGRGVVSLDLTGKAFFADKLDDIPLRSTLESNRTYGTYKGHELSVPFGPTVEYILTDRAAFAAMGEGLLTATIGGGKPVPGALVQVDIAPARLPEATWRQVLELAGMRQNAEAMVRRLTRWQDGHIQLSIEGTQLVLEAHGTRR